MIKRNLALLHFTIRSDLADEPLREGPHQAVYKYLKTVIKYKELDNLEVAAIDKENNSSLDSMPIDKWLQWWEFLVLPVLFESDFNDDLMIEYPDVETELTEL